jgi:hypothetical protein
MSQWKTHNSSWMMEQFSGKPQLKFSLPLSSSFSFFYRNTSAVSLKTVIKHKGCSTFQQKTWDSHYMTAHLFPIPVLSIWTHLTAYWVVSYMWHITNNSGQQPPYSVKWYNFPPEILSHSDNWCTHKWVWPAYSYNSEKENAILHDAGNVCLILS